ncbi:probable G-protein coupled receptor CG31760 [Trichonephila clavipes]|nr:probable G-protein coupled receptor CG31760 [Trichonephila clavipes]
MLYICKRCQPGCDVCEDDSPCLANYNWAFRISLLTISVICIFLTLLLSFYVYRYRKLKVINVASPIFLCITLLGCVIMYFGAQEMGYNITYEVMKFRFSRTTFLRVYRKYRESGKISNLRHRCGRKKMMQERDQS